MKNWKFFSLFDRFSWFESLLKVPRWFSCTSKVLENSQNHSTLKQEFNQISNLSKDFQNRYERISKVPLKNERVWRLKNRRNSKIQILTANLNFHFFTKISNPNLCEISNAFHHPHMKNSKKNLKNRNPLAESFD